MVSKNFLKKVYNLWSTIYDPILDKLFPFDRKKLIDKLKLSTDSKVLEIGVGTGLNLPYYPSFMKEVIGIDISPGMLKKAQEKQTQAKVKLIEADASDMPFLDNYFSHALSSFVLRVSPDAKKTLLELSRVLKPEAKLVVLDQFKAKSWLSYPIKLGLGFGRDFQLEELINQSPFKILNKYKLSKLSNTFIVVLQNNK